MVHVPLNMASHKTLGSFSLLLDCALVDCWPGYLFICACSFLFFNFLILIQQVMPYGFCHLAINKNSNLIPLFDPLGNKWPSKVIWDVNANLSWELIGGWNDCFFYLLFLCTKSKCDLLPLKWNTTQRKGSQGFTNMRLYN